MPSRLFSSVRASGNFLSCSQSQELSQLANLAPEWLIKSERPNRSRLCSLTQLLTITTTQKFPSLGVYFSVYFSYVLGKFSEAGVLFAALRTLVKMEQI